MAINTSPIKVRILGEDKLSKKLDGIDKKSKKWAQKIGNVGDTLNRRLTLPLVIAGGASFKFAKDFNEGMAKVATLIPGNLKRVKELKKEIMNLSAETGLPLEDLTEGTYAAISAWGDSPETIDKLRIAAKAAQAGITDTRSSLSLLSAITELYGDSSKEAVLRTADLAFITQKLAKEAPFGEMAASMGKVAAVSKALGITQEQMFAVVGAGAGITGGTVAETVTQTRSLFTAVTKETPQMGKIVKQYNKKMGTDFKSAAQMMKSVGILEFLQEIDKRAETKRDFTKILGGRVEGTTIAYALLGGRAEKYNEILDAMQVKESALIEAHKEYSDGINKEGYELDKKKRKLINQAVIIGDKLLPVISKLTDSITPLLDKISKMSDEELERWLKIMGGAMLLGPSLKIISHATTAFGGLQSGALLASTNILKLSRGVSNLSAGLKGITGPNVSGLARVVGLLKATGAVAGAGALGAGIGTLLDQLILTPHAADQAEKVQKAIDKQKDIAHKMKTGKLTTKEKVEGAKELQKQKIEAWTGQFSFENLIAGGISSLFTGEKGPFEKFEEFGKESNKLQKELIDSAKIDLQKIADRETKVKIQLDNKSDSGVSVTTEKGGSKKVAPNTGAVMDGI